MSYRTVKRKLDQVYKHAPVVTFDSDSKLVIMSDCHRGQGNAGDNFLANQDVCLGALEYYFHEGFTYIELGDGDELWENRRLKTIAEVHDDIFWILSRFYEQKRLYMVYGNHDIVKRNKGYMNRHCHNYYCNSAHTEQPLLPGITVEEGLVFQNRKDGNEIFMVHGFQGDFLNDTLWPLARFLVRYVWRHMELIGFLDPTGAGRPRKAKERVEKRLADYKMCIRDRGQMEAARSLGLPYGKAMSKVILPQAIRTMLPSIINQFIISIKDTSLVYAIGIRELTMNSQIITANEPTSVMSIYVMAAIYYLVICTILSKVANIVARKLSYGK